MRNLPVLILLALALTGLSCDSTSRSVGAACIDDFDCRDRCLGNWPGGFCTLSCRDDRDCPTDAACVDSRGGICLLLCRDSRECRDILGDNDYKCDDRRTVHRDEADVCVPD